MANVASPCIRQCCLDNDDMCVGCFRSLNEILQWANSTDEQREQILLHVEKRKAHHLRRFPRSPS